MIKLKKAFYPWAVASAALMVVIFLFSSQPAVDSSALSGSLTRAVVGTVWGWFAQGGASAPEVFLDVAETVLRKCAHVFVFFLLGICVMCATRQVRWSGSGSDSKRGGVMSGDYSGSSGGSSCSSNGSDCNSKREGAISGNRSGSSGGNGGSSGSNGATSSNLGSLVFALCCCSAYAATDEIHQIFVAGRAGMWQDWLLDTGGVLLGIGVVLWAIRRRRKKEKNPSDPD